MKPDRLARLVSLEQLGPADACRLQVLAVALREVTRPDRLALLVDEHGAVVVDGDPLLPMDLAQGPKRGGAALGQRPCARVVGLVLVQRDGAALQVEVAVRERCCLARAGAFPMQEAVEHAPAEGHRGRGQELSVLVRIHPALGFHVLHPGQEPFRQRVRGDEAKRKHREREDPMQELCDLSVRAR
ncbi:MAG TPA: hypothetical protein VFF45_00685 [Bacilli bacterium]|nr:hypothetical protein [Bacilli bacterium]